MKQTQDNPKQDKEKDRSQANAEKWLKLSFNEQSRYRNGFLAKLELSYNRVFFSKIPINKLINELWFEQYFEENYDRQEK